METNYIESAKRIWRNKEKPTKTLTFSLTAALFAVSVIGLHFLSETPRVVAWGLTAILLGFVFDLLFTIHDRVKDINSELRWSDHEEAQRHIEKQFVKLVASKNTHDPIKIKIIGVALSYSGPWIKNHFQPLLAKYPGIEVIVEACIIDSNYLRKLEFDPDKPRNWPDEAERNLIELKKFSENTDLSLDNRLKITIYVYQNLPHWHGVLINNQYLYLGRVNWERGSFDTPIKKPRLTVGQNPYRYYHCDDLHCGDERIRLFRNWFRYYKKTAIHKFGYGAN